MKNGPPAIPPHLLACLIAVSLTVLGLGATVAWCDNLEARYIHALAPEFTPEKLQGVALQHEAFAHPDLLVLYGSSELVKEMPNNATQYFQDYPTGFRVFPVGKPGTTSLAVLQKVAAVGPGIKGRKVAFSISPGWFFTEIFDPTFYEGNFSELQATELTFSLQLSRELKRDVARRMLDFPKTIENNALLSFSLRHLAGDSGWNRIMYGISLPLGRLQCAVGRIQDHVESALYILEADEQLDPTPKRGLRALHWNEVLKQAAKISRFTSVQTKANEVKKKRIPYASRDGTFMQTMRHAREWTDIELLMRTFQELGASPLFLSMPVEDIRLEVYGISNKSRLAYTARMDALATKYQIALADFPEHEKDNSFLVDFLDHLSGEGWLFYNKALDDFFHDRFKR